MQEQVEIPWMLVAKELLGTKENPAKRSNNPDILEWARLAEIPGYTSDDIPWCGLFVAHCLVECGVEYVEKPLWALNWAKFDQKLDEPTYGSIMSFKRNGGGHVGFYVGEDEDHYHILGGNQSNAVTIAKIEKSRFVSANWPTRMIARLGEGEEVAGDFDKSTNEA